MAGTAIGSVSDANVFPDPVMSLRIRLAGLGLVGICAALLSVLTDAPQRTTDVIVLGAALVAGYLIELRPAERMPLPIGFAVAVVLVRAAPLGEYTLVVTLAAFAGVLLRPDLHGLKPRALTWVDYAVSGVACGIVFHAASGVGSRADSTLPLLLALGAAALTEIFVSDTIGAMRGRKPAPFRARGADLALVSSGILMATGYAGISGKGSLGLWGPALFSIPLIAAWYSLELGDRTRRTFRQTVQALGVAPELGGMTPAGHVERVADLAVGVAQNIGINEGHLDDLETAAWLHHLGAVCLDEPEAGGSLDPTEVARAGAEMLRASRALSDAGDILAADPGFLGAQVGGSKAQAQELGQILRIASEYDELTDGDDRRASSAIDALTRSAEYDGQVVQALADVVRRRRAIDSQADS